MMGHRITHIWDALTLRCSVSIHFQWLNDSKRAQNSEILDWDAIMGHYGPLKL